jgi:hypothetical protein
MRKWALLSGSVVQMIGCRFIDGLWMGCLIAISLSFCGGTSGKPGCAGRSAFNAQREDFSCLVSRVATCRSWRSRSPPL